jgi:hypothetical protein
MSAPRSIAHYLNIRQAYGPSLSADGQWVAFITNITGVPQVWQVPLALDTDHVLWPEQLTFEPDRISVVSYSPVPGDNRMLYGRDGTLLSLAHYCPGKKLQRVERRRSQGCRCYGIAKQHSGCGV